VRRKPELKVQTVVVIGGSYSSGIGLETARGSGVRGMREASRNPAGAQDGLARG
jgi:hypothetical protein